MLKKAKRTGHWLEAKLLTPGYLSELFEPIIGYYDNDLMRVKKGRVLICYLTEPFRLEPKSPQIYEHQNMQRAIEIARVFNRMGYVADIVSCFDGVFIPNYKYHVLFGVEHCFERMALVLGKTATKIYLATGPYPPSRHASEQKRRDAIKKRRGTELMLRFPGWNAPDPSLVDAVVAIGNSWVVSTYKPFYKSVYATGDGGFDFLHSTIEQKDFVSARQNFMWMASWLSVVKGLDLVLEVFSQLPELNLFVCGPIWNEKDFLEEYERELFHTPNIHVMGKQKLNSFEFAELTKKVGFTIFPTAGDAAAGSVWAPMRCGVIPIVSIENGMDTRKFGVTLKDCSMDEIRTAVLEASVMSPEQCRDMAYRACNIACREYTLEAWSRRFETVLRNILS